MTTITARPYDIGWSRNPVKYTLHTDTALTTAGLQIEVQLQFKLFSAGAFEEVHTFSLTPDKDGNASIDWRRILDSKLSFQIPTTLNEVELCDEQTGLFYVKFREITAADTNPAWEDDVANTFHVYKGGLPEHRWHRSKYFTDFTYQWKLWMTWKKNNFKIFADQYNWLTYQHRANDTAVGAKVKIKLYYSDGTNDETTLIDAPGGAGIGQFLKNATYRIPIGIKNLALDAVQAAKTIVRYTVTPINSDDIAQTNSFDIFVDYRNFYDTISMHYFNSLGGFDTQAILGEINPTQQRTFDMAESNAANDGTSNILPAMLFTQQVEEQMMFRGNVGLIESNDEQDRLRDMLTSKEVYEYKFDQWYRLNILNQSTELGSRNRDLLDLPIEWSYGYVNESYAPDQLNLLQ
jgi:hypothetical protein